MRARKSTTHSVDKPVDETSKSGFFFPLLEGIPIDDPQHEKNIFEKGDDLRELNPVHTSGSPVAFSYADMDKRIIEVYRLCFAEATPDGQSGVLSDFVAHFPYLVFEADWVRQLALKNRPPGFTSEERRQTFYAALASGFRSAATNKEKIKASAKQSRLLACREMLKNIQDEISTWDAALERPLSTPPEISKQAAQKAENLIQAYSSKLGPRDKPKLTKMLEKGQAYDAACYTVWKLMGVRERDLQSRPK